MSEHKDSPRDLFGNPIVEVTRRRRGSASRARLRPDEEVDPNRNSTPNSAHTFDKPAIAKQPVRLYLPSKWPCLALAGSLAVMVAAAALKIPLAKTPIVELDFTSSDSRTTIGLMSMLVFACAAWLLYEALTTVAFNSGLKAWRKPVVCANNRLKAAVVGVVAATMLSSSVGAVWFTWKYTHPQIRHVVALLEEFGRNPPSEIETSAIPEPSNPADAITEPPVLQELPREVTPPKPKNRRRMQSQTPDKDWIEAADKWFMDIFSPSELPANQGKRK